MMPVSMVNGCFSNAAGKEKDSGLNRLKELGETSAKLSGNERAQTDWEATLDRRPSSSLKTGRN
jgi:hypothetical protein